MSTMAMLLFPRVWPLSCKTAAVLRIMITSLPSQTLHSTVRSHSCMPVVMKRPSITSLRTCELPNFWKSGVGVRQNCLSFSSDHRNPSRVVGASESDSQKTEGKCGASASISYHLKNSTNGRDDPCSSQSVNTAEISSVLERQNSSSNDFNQHVVHKHQAEGACVTKTSDWGSGSGIQYSSKEYPVETQTMDSQLVYEMHSTTHVPVTEEPEDLQDLPPSQIWKPSFNLAPYVPKSEVLQKLLALGVDLSAVEKVKGAADCLVQADWTTDIQPRLLFLRDVGVEDSELGRVLTKNPLLLKEDIEEMQGRIIYLESKKFSQEQISHIVTHAPLTLLLPVTYMDRKLGFLQKTFRLTGDEVRLTASRLPKIIPWKLQKLKDIRFYMMEMLGFSDRELKAMLLATPRVFLSDRHQLGKRFDFLHNVMGLSHQHLTAWPAVFRTRLHVVEQRHRFLLLLGRAQYDPTKENYVSLKALVSGKDKDFCANVAKASVDQFYSFLKSL